MIPLAIAFHGVVHSQEINRAELYRALRSPQLALLDAQISSLNASGNALTRAFEGALFMRKAGLLQQPAEKLKLFRRGKEELENEIRSDPGNTEFRFLRLIIQENSPPVLQYKSSLKEDAEQIENGFSTLEAALKKEIRAYSRSSQVLKDEKLK
jgi:hypothetical protein